MRDVIHFSKKLKILYVEDNQEAREATLIVLDEFFKETVVAIDGQDGIEKFQENRDLDLIITDINMPRMNGLVMTKAIREINKDIPILVLSAYNESGFFIESIKLGIEGYLLKPIDIKQFVVALKKIIETLKVNAEINLLHQYQDVADRISIISKTDLSGRITYINEVFCQLIGYTAEEVIGKNHNIIRHPDTPNSLYKELWDTIKNKKNIWRGILKIKTKNGKSKYLDSIIKPILNTNGEPMEYISIKSDITDIMDQKKRLLGLLHGSNTNILLICKIDGYDDIEKYYGQTIAQEIDKEFAKVLARQMPQGFQNEDFYALDNGIYAVVKDYTLCTLTKEDIITTFQKMQETINESIISVNDIEYDVEILISVAFGKDVYKNAIYGFEKLKASKQTFIIATDLVEKEREEAHVHLDTLKMIKNALDTNNVVTYFQAIVNNANQEIVKYETLVRIIDGDKIISPYFFLDISKKGKYYAQITTRVLEQSFAMLQKIDEDISINLSALDIEKKSTREKIFQLLDANKDKTSRVIFELLEDEAMKNFQVIKDFITQVKNYGVMIAIDDFGAGFSNFERLLDYQPDILKIDACLIKNIVHDKYSLDVVETIVAFAKKQNIQTVGEYVENEEIYNILKKIGVDYSQGYYFAQPKPLD